ncbi:MAG: bifunctional pyr operon transcriptional regulator/uracil phosphoribosyltransferase PyrR [Flavobacteriaceae bacterium]|jgi:pyrimidine operon attenuation protein/uracil phosphoribosyltransferase|nr:bifunctional pyr operon transcriptional regulator/uracil phosphoribosyltransferase PyrR [Flavobacteriaceae bacterium]MBT6447705.1 bifunctional pyr operon transcriptional regulator/uracil phosphoribosyltransferase PyrR [Flavobacteriaceae bacterium]MDG1830104.1 bifunctional pyr operon transcriptional regulator/uracil phosphoribosyltransferase PyrR [Flavobacteriaceae bacterium]|tara:strand:+ start:635 stop:1174 length:540 start_codon:yes stop_codon:yes gene_type:complete
MTPKKILNANEISTILHRLSFQLIEDHHDFADTVIIAIQPRGVLLAERIVNFLTKESFKIQLGLLDITFYRDDFRRNEKVLKANKTILDFSIENKTVVLIDDVLYTGRSIRAALDALQSYGRPKAVQLLNLIDRRFSRELPIQPDYCGIQVDSRLNQKVKVNWKEHDGEDSVYLFKNKE